MRRHPSRLPATLAAWFSVAAPGCGDPDADDGGGTGMPGVPGTVTLLGTLDPNAFCDMPQVVSIQVQATRIGCVSGPPAPCTLPADPQPVAGDTRSCPVTDPEIVLGVDVTAAGRYRFEAIGPGTAGGQTRRCFAVDGDLEIVVADADLEAAASIFATATDAPCPATR